MAGPWQQLRERYPSKKSEPKQEKPTSVISDEEAADIAAQAEKDQAGYGELFPEPKGEKKKENQYRNKAEVGG